MKEMPGIIDMKKREREKWPEVGLYACYVCGTVRVHGAIDGKLPHRIDAYCYACSNTVGMDAIAIDFETRRFLLVLT